MVINTGSNCGTYQLTSCPGDDELCMFCWLPTDWRFQMDFKRLYGCLPDTESKIQQEES